MRSKNGPLAPRQPTARSRVSNGTSILVEGDGRSAWCRRMRDVMSLHVSDLGGQNQASEAELSIIRRAATLTVELERLEARFASSEQPDAGEFAAYITGANALRRLLADLGLHRVPKDVTPHPLDYAREFDHRKAAEAGA